MSNYILKNGDIEISPPMSESEAVERLDKIKMIYPNAVMVSTSEEVVSRKINESPAEIVDDVGCAGGGCAL